MFSDDDQETETQRLVREMAERMLGRDILDQHCNPNYVDPERRQVDWEIGYENAKEERRQRNYEARKAIRFRERWGGNDT